MDEEVFGGSVLMVDGFVLMGDGNFELIGSVPLPGTYSTRIRSSRRVPTLYPADTHLEGEFPVPGSKNSVQPEMRTDGSVLMVDGRQMRRNTFPWNSFSWNQKMIRSG